MRVDPFAPIHADVLQAMGWHPGVYKGRWIDTPQVGPYEAAGWKKGGLLRRICPMYGSDAQTIPEISMFLWEIGYALQVRYSGEWVYASVHSVARYSPDNIVITGDPVFEAASEMPNANPAVCSVFLDAIHRHQTSEKTKKAAATRKANRQRARKNGQNAKDQK